MSYTDKFSNTSVPPAGTSFAAITLAANATFAWPYSYSGALKVISKIMEITCSNGVVMTLPSATEVSKGEDFIVRNVGANTLTINNNTGGAVGTVAAGAVLAVYLKDNSTAAGTWGTVAYGVGTSSVDAATLAGAGLYPIAATLNQEFAVYAASPGFNVTTAYRAQLVNYTGGAGTITFSAVATLGDGFFVLIRNSGTGTLTLNPDDAELIDGTSTIVLQPGESAIVSCSGTALFTVGLGRSTEYQFTQLTKDLSTCSLPSCTGNVTTLTSIEASNKLMTFLGNPGAAQTIVVPDVVAVYYVYNALSTAQSVTVKTLNGNGSLVTQTGRAILFCDGVHVFAAQTVAVTSALEMQDGNDTAPGLHFSTPYTNTGVYRATGSQLGIAVNGAMSAIFGSSGLITATAPNLTSTNLNAALAELQADIDTRATSAAITSAVSVHAALTASHGVAGALVGTTDTQTLTSKTLASPTINGTVATTGLTLPAFSAGAITGTTFNGTTIPTSKTLVDTTSTQSAANLTAGQATAALGLKTTGATVVVSGAAAPSTGQVLTATSGTAASWATPAAPGTGTVTGVSVVSVNGFTGSATGAPTPAITLTTSITGLLKGNAGALTAASAGTDFVLPGGALGSPSTGNLANCTFPTLNQSTTGNATTATTATVAEGLKTTGATVVVSGATPPTTGQVLKATSATAATWQDAASGSTVGRHTVYIPAGAMTPRTTNGATFATAETATQRVMLKTLTYVETPDTYAQFSIRMPTSWNEGTMSAYFSFSVPTNPGATATVWFSIAAVAFGNGETLDVARGLAKTVSTNITTTSADKLIISAESDPLTADGAIVAGDWVVFEVNRNSSDTYGYDARLHGVTLIYTTDADVDAA